MCRKNVYTFYLQLFSVLSTQLSKPFFHVGKGILRDFNKSTPMKNKMMNLFFYIIMAISDFYRKDFLL